MSFLDSAIIVLLDVLYNVRVEAMALQLDGGRITKRMDRVHSLEMKLYQTDKQTETSQLHLSDYRLRPIKYSSISTLYHFNFIHTLVLK